MGVFAQRSEDVGVVAAAVCRMAQPESGGEDSARPGTFSTGEVDMSIVHSRFCGDVEYSEDAVIRLPHGLAPFVGQTKYLLLSDEERKPLIFLQSVEEPGLCFITMPAALACPAYSLELAKEHVEALYGPEGKSDAALMWLVILTVPETGAVTANLLAPLVIDLERKIGMQAVRADGQYSHAQPLADGRQKESLCSS